MHIAFGEAWTCSSSPTVALGEDGGLWKVQLNRDGSSILHSPSVHYYYSVRIFLAKAGLSLAKLFAEDEEWIGFGNNCGTLMSPYCHVL